MLAISATLPARTFTIQKACEENKLFEMNAAEHAGCREVLFSPGIRDQELPLGKSPHL